MNQILFLDIDGVLNSWQSVYYWDRLGREVSYAMCPIAVSNLNELMSKNPDLRIVISSTWRLYKSLERLREIFSEFGFLWSQRIIDYTPHNTRSDQRWDEIKEYIDNSQVGEFLILDDRPLMADEHPDYEFVKDNSITTDAKIGFSWVDLLRANTHFKGHPLGVVLM